MNSKKRGEMSSSVLVGLLLALVFASIIIYLAVQFTSPQAHLTAKQNICRYSIMLSQTPLKTQPICPTQIVPFTEKNILKQAHSGESTKDAAMRQILDSMLSCKSMVEGQKRTGFISGKSCYVCYSLQTDATTPYLTEQDLASYSINHRASTGQSYFFELNKENHWPLVFLNGGIGVKDSKAVKAKDIYLGKDYGITYVSVNKGSFLQTIGDLTAGTGGCALAGLTWFIPYVGPAVGLTIAPAVCHLSMTAATGTALFSMFKLSPEGDGTLLLFTDYQYLEEYGCGDNYVS